MKILEDFTKSQLVQFSCAPWNRGRKLQFPECLESSWGLKLTSYVPPPLFSDWVIQFCDFGLHFSHWCTLKRGQLQSLHLVPSSPPALPPLHQDGGRRSWWEIQKHSQQKQRPLGAAHLCDQVREAGGRGRDRGQRLDFRFGREKGQLIVLPLLSKIHSYQKQDHSLIFNTSQSYESHPQGASTPSKIHFPN